MAAPRGGHFFCGRHLIITGGVQERVKKMERIKSPTIQDLIRSTMFYSLSA